MEKAHLAAELESGRSIEAIARELDRDPSTVAYWVNKHGLASTYARKHAARGGLTREQLEPLVEAGLSVRAVAEQVGRSYATVQHWLKKHGLETARTRRRRQTPRPGEEGPAILEGTCDVHGPTMFARRADGYYRCLACRADAVVKRRRTVKQISSRRRAGPAASAVMTAFRRRCSSITSIRSRRHSAFRTAA
jgi:transposase